MLYTIIICFIVVLAGLVSQKYRYIFNKYYTDFITNKQGHQITNQLIYDILIKKGDN